MSSRARYTYVNEHGEPAHQVRRGPHKRFTQFSPAGEGRWRPGLRGVRTFLYRLPEVLEQVRSGGEVYVVEGEKDADRLASLGLIATTNAGGAGKWRAEYSFALIGARVRLVRDNDDAGLRHARDIVRSLRMVGVSDIRVYRARAGKDVSDHLDAGLDLDDLVDESVDERSRAESSQQKPSVAVPAAFRLTLERLQAWAAEHRLPLPRVREDGRYATACCPAHDDRRPSLTVAVGEDHSVVLYCHAGCSLDQIAAALAIDPSEFSGRAALPKSDFETLVAAEMRRIEVREDARRRLAAEALDLAYLPPVGETLADDLLQPRQTRKYTVDRLHLAGGNSVLISGYKVGKTTLCLGLMKSLADSEPLLGEFDVAAFEGRVGYVNYELSADTFREWVEDAGIQHPERVAAPIHARGRSLPFWVPEGRKRLAEWLVANKVVFLILDPFARAASGLVLSENDNAQVGAFLDALDALKLEAGVPDLLLATHMGRERFEENAERSRGATRLEDWMDAGWYLTKDRHDTRSLRAMGRDVDLAAIDLAYDNAERRLYATGQTRAQRREQEGINRAIEALLRIGDGVTSTELADAIEGEKGRRSGWIKAAAVGGFIERRYKDGRVHDESAAAPRGVPLRCYLTETSRVARSGIVRAGKRKDGE
jgi:RecA-family ATPase